jgi:hypothetical protein
VRKGAALRLLSYVVARDYGFAPNPFFGICTLATCKPNIRRAAQLGDLVVGTGSAARQRKGYLVFAMKVDEAKTFNEYWDDPRFQQKKPNLRGSKKQAFGDIYVQQGGKWHQRDSHHSFADGTPNPANIANDTQTDRVLIGFDYIYWGRSGPKIPARFRNFQGYDICAGRNHKSNFPSAMVDQFIAWLLSHDWNGYMGDPLDWSRTP